MSDPISVLLLTLGIRSTYRGFWYIRYAIKLCLEDERYLLSVYKTLYTVIADEYQTKQDNVEHCIRTAVSSCWYHGNRDFLRRIARYPLSTKPTNSEFLDILYHYLKANQNE